MSCLAVTINRIGGNISAAMNPVIQPVSATLERRGGITASMGLVCGTGLGPWEVLYASDGVLLTKDGEVIFVRKEGR